ncbi:hypothetical protein Leryth_018353 [Lithospermum erythrorhizon]|nr:hypothetical protein Leryth_018353 [Lithospermum erythrorhizon]
MGSSFSSFTTQQITPMKPPPPQTTLSDLPESSLASILIHLDPPQICSLAILNKAFNSASSADFVWESKLPENYEYLTKRVFFCDDNNGDKGKLCKKEVYARLCRPNSFDGGSKRAWLDKSSGRVCMSIASHGLAITGIDDRRYWSRMPMDESRFASVAYLQQTWWFEVDGEVEFPFPPGSYSLFFR